MKFNFDNPVFHVLGKIVDCFYASLLWLLFCIPIVTAGAATSALYYTAHKSIRGGRGYVGKCFWQSFLGSFKQATLCWLAALLVLTVTAFDLIFTWTLPVFYAFLVVALLVVGWCCILFPYIARFENGVKDSLKYVLFLEFRHLPWTLLLLVILAVVLFLGWLLPFLVVVLPALMFLLYDAVLERLFRRYMSPEDLAHEMELEELDRREDSLG